MESTIARKITITTFGEIKEDAERRTKQKPVMGVVGIVESYGTEQSQYGEFTRLYGDFIALNPDRTKQVRAASCILPNFMSKKIVSELDRLIDGETGEMGKTEFAISFFTVPDASGKFGYVHVAEPLSRPEPMADPLVKLLARHLPGEAAKLLGEEKPKK